MNMIIRDIYYCWLLLCPFQNAFSGYHNPICTDFMSVLMPRRPWKREREPCIDSFYEQDDFLRAISGVMVAMNTSLTVFTSYEPNELCVFDYPNVKTYIFDAVDLLQEYNFSISLIAIMSNWDYIGYTRASDIYRILLAHKFQKAYIDTDVHLLDLQKELYTKSFVGAAMWAEEKAAIEITNSAFCLPQDVLQDMIVFMRNRIGTGNDDYFYTELGPSMFHKILINKYSVALYSQNHPEEHGVQDMVKHLQRYSHRMLHITGRIRIYSKPLTFLDIIGRVRQESGLGWGAVTVPASTRAISEEAYFDASYQNLLLMDYNLVGWFDQANHLQARFNRNQSDMEVLDRLVLSLTYVVRLMDGQSQTKELKDQAASALEQYSKIRKGLSRKGAATGSAAVSEEGSKEAIGADTRLGSEKVKVEAGKNDERKGKKDRKKRKKASNKKKHRDEI